MKLEQKENDEKRKMNWKEKRSRIIYQEMLYEKMTETKSVSAN